MTAPEQPQAMTLEGALTLARKYFNKYTEEHGWDDELEEKWPAELENDAHTLRGSIAERDDTAELVEVAEAYFEASDNYMVEQDGHYQEALGNLRAILARVKGETT